MLDAKSIRESLSLDDVTKILLDLGSGQPQCHDKGLKFQTVCHNYEGGSYKLWYYSDSFSFTCYTGCGSESFNIYDLVIKNNLLHGIDMKFYDAVKYVATMTGKTNLKTDDNLDKQKALTDVSFVNNFHMARREKVKIKLPTYSEQILNLFQDIYYDGWIEEGISIEAMRKYGVKLYTKDFKIVIPHYDIDGNLVGIRVRTLNQDDIDMGRKYMPLYIRDNVYKLSKEERKLTGSEYRGFTHNLSANLYGLYQNKDTIKRFRKVVIFEGEKSVMKFESYFPNQNFSVCMGGSGKLSIFLRDMLIRLGVEEIIYCFDREYEKCGSEQDVHYSQKMARIMSPLMPYFNVSIVYDRWDILNYKDSPIDQGKENFEYLLENRVMVTQELIDEILNEDEDMEEY